jgi:trimeric autotransporter adhesin
VTSASGAVTPATCPLSSTGVMSPLLISHTLNEVPVSGLVAGQLNQVVPSPNSALAFITYQPPTSGGATPAVLPYYIPGTGGAAGTVSSVTLAGTTSTAPLAGAFTPDGTLFFVSTAGDNLIHYISIPTSVTAATPPTDTQQIAPNLPSCIPVSAGGTDLGCAYTGTGSVVPASIIVVKPRSTT